MKGRRGRRDRHEKRGEASSCSSREGYNNAREKKEGPQNWERKRTNPGAIVTAFRAAENLAVKMADGGRCASGNINKSVNGVSGLMLVVARSTGGPGWRRFTQHSIEEFHPFSPTAESSFSTASLVRLTPPPFRYQRKKLHLATRRTLYFGILELLKVHTNFGNSNIRWNAS